MSLQPIYERNQEATVYVGNLDGRVNEDLLWELFTNAGPVINVHVPRDKITGEHMAYGFIEFRTEEDAEYAIKILHMIKMFGKAIKINKASRDKQTMEVGANLYIGNLDPDVDDKLLYDTFSAFGIILNTKVVFDAETREPRGFGFVSFDNFDSSDNAINAMNGQYLANRVITVSYAFKKDSKTERHGSAAERLLAASRQTAKPTISDTNNQKNSTQNTTGGQANGASGNVGNQMAGDVNAGGMGAGSGMGDMPNMGMMGMMGGGMMGMPMPMGMGMMNNPMMMNPRNLPPIPNLGGMPGMMNPMMMGGMNAMGTGRPGFVPPTNFRPNMTNQGGSGGSNQGMGGSGN
mmetsp:Transcript_57785/g.65932  ORF Transcript_57785/g.65932 Transcript_57785/m.65932 type:complete len:348 (-) Transcript_57785:50-1093(-)